MPRYGVRVAPSPSETRRFGLRTARITVDRAGKDYSHSALAGAVSGALHAIDADLVILRFPSRDLSLVGLLDRRGWETYPAGTLVYWEAPGSAGVRTTTSRADSTRVESMATDSELQAVIEDSFADYVNHYFANPLISPTAVTAGYVEWALATASDPANRVFIEYADAQPVGVAVVRADGLSWEIELAGIISSRQRHGHYTRLIKRVLSRAREEDVMSVEISTQAHNIPVQRAWAKLGFLPSGAVETVHLARARG